MSDYIPAELVTLILRRLPGKSLLRFRCVCKQWLSIITSPSFISEHLSLSLSNPTHTLIRHYSKRYSKEIYTLHSLHCDISSHSAIVIGFPFSKLADYYTRVVAYCHGILCITDDTSGDYERIALWNPSIYTGVLLPRLPTPEFIYGTYTQALGFGFDPKSKDYKIVRVLYLEPDVHRRVSSRRPFELPPRVDIFSLSSGKWTTLEPEVLNNIKTIITQTFWAQSIVEGFIHWNAYKVVMDEAGARAVLNVILKFDLGTNVFEELSLPTPLAEVLSVLIFPINLKGKFSVVYLHLDNDIHLHDSNADSDFSIWVMEDYSDVGSWTQKYKIKLDVELGTVLGVRRDGEIMLTTKSGELVSYNYASGKVTSTGMFSTVYSFFMEEYVDSLALFDKTKLYFQGLLDDYEYEDKRIEEMESEYRNMGDILNSIDRRI